MAGQQEHRFVLGASAYNESLSNKTTVTDDVTADVTAAAVPSPAPPEVAVLALRPALKSSLVKTNANSAASSKLSQKTFSSTAVAMNRAAPSKSSLRAVHIKQSEQSIRGMQKMVAARQRDSRSSLASNVSFGQLSASLARSRSQMPFASRSAAQSPVDNDDEDFDFDVGETDEDSVPRRAARIRSLHLGLVRHELPKEQKSVKFRGDRIQGAEAEATRSKAKRKHSLHLGLMKDDIADDNGEKAVVEEYRPVPVRSEKQLSAKKKKSLHLGLMKHEMPAFEHKSTGVTPGRIPSQSSASQKKPIMHKKSLHLGLVKDEIHSDRPVMALQQPQPAGSKQKSSTRLSPSPTVDEAYEQYRHKSQVDSRATQSSRAQSPRVSWLMRDSATSVRKTGAAAKPVVSEEAPNMSGLNEETSSALTVIAVSKLVVVGEPTAADELDSRSTFSNGEVVALGGPSTTDAARPTTSSRMVSPAASGRRVTITPDVTVHTVPASGRGGRKGGGRSLQLGLASSDLFDLLNAADGGSTRSPVPSLREQRVRD